MINEHIEERSARLHDCRVSYGPDLRSALSLSLRNSSNDAFELLLDTAERPSNVSGLVVLAGCLLRETTLKVAEGPKSLVSRVIKTGLQLLIELADRLLVQIWVFRLQ